MRVCIPTKGRPATKTYKLFEEIGFSVLHYVEPQDFEDYKNAGVPNIVPLAENDQGLSFSRNTILADAKRDKVDWLWVCDDDVSGFGIAKNGKTIRGTASVLVEFFEKVKAYKFPINGINYCQYAWSYSKGKRYTANTKSAEVCVLFYMPKITWTYYKGMKHDRDFCMQAIEKSDGVLMDLHTWFDCPPIGTNKGGLHEHYKDKKNYHSAQHMVEKWKPYAKLVQKKGKLDCKFDFKGFAKANGKVIK